jgi:hypothetical protein
LRFDDAGAAIADRADRVGDIAGASGAVVPGRRRVDDDCDADDRGLVRRSGGISTVIGVALPT